MKNTANINMKHKTRKPLNKCRFNAEPFLNIQTPEVAYILGLLWADGYIYNGKDQRRNKISIECIESDLITILDVFMKTGLWSYHKRSRPNRQPQMCIGVSNRYLYEFLLDCDYNTKTNSADKILSKIPDHLKHYWFRGLVDGDGNFYYNNKTTVKQFNCSSAMNQNWVYLTKLLDSLNIIKYTIRNKVLLTNRTTSNKESSYSDIRITNRADIIRFGDYIYQNYENDKIGLVRKYNTFIQIKNSPNIRPKIK